MTNGRLQRTRVGVLGTGEVGRRLAAGFNSRGHEVVIGSRDPEKSDLREWLSNDGAGVQAAAFREAAEHGELLVLAVLGDAAQDVIAQVDPKNFGGKVVIDAMNPLDFRAGFRLSSRSRVRTRLASAFSACPPAARVAIGLSSGFHFGRSAAQLSGSLPAIICCSSDPSFGKSFLYPSSLFCHSCCALAPLPPISRKKFTASSGR